jgi:uncharacterized membrane protein
MLPDPLHPALVHFPLALAFLIPLFVIGAIVAMRRGVAARRAWSLVVALMALLAASSFLAVKTGEDEEEVVEEVVDHDFIHEHEEKAEMFRNLALLTLVLATAGLATGKVGGFGRGAATGMAFVLAWLAWGVGESGGDLVYEQGAANAYIEQSNAAMPAEEEHDDEEAHDDEDDD